jgi:OOP family OmpA-OmpF porin
LHCQFGPFGATIGPDAAAIKHGEYRQRRRERLMRGRLGLLVLGCVFCLLAGSAMSATRARAQGVPNQQISTNRFVPAIGAANYLQLDGAVVGGHMTPSVEIVVDYAHRPFVIYEAKCPGGDTNNCEVKASKRDIVKAQFDSYVGGTLTMWQRVQFGLMLPLVYTTGDGYHQSTGAALAATTPYIDIRGGSAFGVGDPRLSAKVRLAGEGTEGFLLAGVAYLTAPLGDSIAPGHNLGDDGFTAGAKLAADYRAGKLRVGANAGAVFRPDRTILSTTTGSEMQYGVAAGFDVTSLLTVVSEVAAATDFTRSVDGNPVEWRVGAKLTQGDFVFQLGGGAGLLSGVGTPNFRIIGGAAWQPAGIDSDGDGIGDNVDACPAEKEDKDGYLDDDGCPDLDNDGDGIEDSKDKCPNDAEDPDGFQDQDGCPDRDNDNDGIQDGYDSCPDQAEDKDGDRDEDGCPDNDRDRDGIEDSKDKCPDVPEDTDGFGDDDGCPEVDFDGDGIPDDQDQCPDQMEDKDGFEDDDGCPEDGGPPAKAAHKK